MRSTICLLTILLIVTFTSIACRSDTSREYIHGNMMTERLEIIELQGGVVGFTGTYYTIEQDGSWATGPVLPGEQEKRAPMASGRLTGEQVVQLTGQLDRNKLSSLSSHGATAVNPRILKIRFGNQWKVLQPKPDSSSEEEDEAIRKRYNSILSTVESLCR